MNCEVIKDLYGIYSDGCASPYTKKIISSHLKSCADCREFYREVSKPSAYVCPEHIGNYESVAKRIKRREIINAITVSAAAVVAVTLASHFSNRK